MSVNYHLSDILVRINVSIKARNIYCLLNNDKFSRVVASILYKEGLIMSFFIKNKNIFIKLKYKGVKSLIKKLTLVSKPGKRIYLKLNELRVLQSSSGLNSIYILSTNQGLLTYYQAVVLRRRGGEVLFKIDLNC